MADQTKSNQAQLGKTKIVIPGRPKKRLFIGVLALTMVLVQVLLYGIWYIARPGLAGIAPVLPTVVGGIFAVMAAAAMLGLINMVLAVAGLCYLPLLRRQSYTFVNLLFPLAVQLGRPFGINKRRLEGSFIAVSNLLFSRLGIRVPADRLLVVTPHCLQLATCPHKITRDPMGNCQRCGGCDIGALVALAEEKGFHFFVVTGGTLARQTVKKIRPKVVLAIACERDLTSGIQDVYPLPAVGVMNIRPNGPCYNTHVDMEQVRREIDRILLTDEENRHG